VRTSADPGPRFLGVDKKEKNDNMRLWTAFVTALIAATLLSPSAQANDYCVSGDRSVRELYVAPGEVCEFDPDKSSTLRVTAGSILVEGTLRMRPSSHDVVHRIVFENVHEEGFKGSGLGPSGPNDPILESDPGLWAVRSGVLDIVGSRKTGWTREPDSAEAWTGKCELRVTPTRANDFDSRPFELGDSVPRAYDAVPKAEVFNLTRNVIIGGTPKGRSHVFINTDGPQTIKYANFEHTGPRCSCKGAEDGEKNGPIVGRWGLHFHMMDDASRGSLVEGVVISRGAGRGFVPHSSHGITFRDTVAYDVAAGGYWWDVNEKKVEHETEDTLFEHALAVDTTSNGFFLPDSAVPHSNVIRDSVAAGVEPDGFSSTVAGFQWGSRGDGVWLTEDVVSHNNRRNWYRWNNHAIPEQAFDTTIYNGQAAIMQGAYKANHLYEGMTIRGDLLEWKTSAGIKNKKPKKDKGKDKKKPEDSGPTKPLAGLIDFDIDVAGRHPQALHLAGAQVSGSDPTVFINGRLTGYTGKFAVTGELMHHSRAFDFIRVKTKDGSELGPEDINISAKNRSKGMSTVIRIEKSNGAAWQITLGRAGRTVSSISSFS
jgi:hypothetical protein